MSKLINILLVDVKQIELGSICKHLKYEHNIMPRDLCGIGLSVKINTLDLLYNMASGHV
ncbi:MAG: hypothetical protein WCT77_04360 [Bacteroidota bacterium]